MGGRTARTASMSSVSVAAVGAAGAVMAVTHGERASSGEEELFRVRCKTLSK